MSPSNRFRVFGVTPHFAGKHMVSYSYCRWLEACPFQWQTRGWCLVALAAHCFEDAWHLNAVRLQALCRIAFMLSRTGVVRGMQLVPGSSAEQSWLGLVG